VRNEFTELLFNTCSRYIESRENSKLLEEIREPLWAYLRQQCPSFLARDSNACFSQIFGEKTFGKPTPDEMNLFSSLRTFQSLCETCQKDVVLNSSILVNYVTRSALQKCELSCNSWPQFVSAIQTQPGKSTCPDCGTSSCELVLTSTADSKFVLIEFTPELMDVVKFYENITVGQSEYKLRGMVRSHNRHFTCAVFTEGKWTYIDDLCLDVKTFSNLAALEKHFAQGWFFLIYEVSNMVCKSQLYELDNEHIEASIDFTEIPIKKRKHFKSGVKVETSVTCCNYYDVLIEDNNVSQVICPKSNFIKGQFPSNKLQQQNIPKPKDTRKRKTVSLNVTTKKKAKLSSTVESSNNSKVKNEMPIHSQPFAKQNMTKFHNRIRALFIIVIYVEKLGL